MLNYCWYFSTGDTSADPYTECTRHQSCCSCTTTVSTPHPPQHQTSEAGYQQPLACTTNPCWHNHSRVLPIDPWWSEVSPAWCRWWWPHAAILHPEQPTASPGVRTLVRWWNLQNVTTSLWTTIHNPWINFWPYYSLCLCPTSQQETGYLHIPIQTAPRAQPSPQP